MGQLLAAALELPEKERTAFLSSACSEDRELRQEVDELLSMAPAAHGLFQNAAFEELGGGDDESAQQSTRDPVIGSAIGRYRIERLLGRGGMGAVYAASRGDEAYEQQVAVKVLHPGLESRGHAGRFLAERQILAVLDHPSIARLLDGGTTSDGRPFLVMEYVEGEPLDRYCETSRLTIPQRIELFRKVCEAVAFAHRNLVVHRDIKPSNILVTDGGVPKLLDFGIAKLLDPASFPLMVEATRTGLRPMSPAYASPEQIRGQVVTTATDIYSLGVVLYKLLTGRLPFDASHHSAAVMEQATRREPTLPSVAVTQEPPPASGGEPSARGPGIEARQLKRQLEGDLDTIVLMALREEPEGRYGTVDELSDDLERFLEAEPVRARRSTPAYRAKKFIRRHRAAVGVAVIIASLLLGSTLMLMLQARRIAGERDRAEGMAEFTAGLFEVSGPARIMDPFLTTQEIVQRGAFWRERELADDPVLRSDQLLILGRAYRSFNDYESAMAKMLESLQLKEELYGDTNPEMVAALNGLASLYLMMGRSNDAEALLKRGLAIGRVNASADQLELATCNALLGELWWGRWEPAQAIGNFRTALAITERVLGPDHPEVAMRLVMLGNLMRVFEPGSRKAERLFRRGLEIQNRLIGGEPDLWRTYESLGLLYRDRGQLARAATMLDRSLDSLTENRYLDPSDRNRLFYTIGLIAHGRGHLTLAERYLRQSLGFVRTFAIEETETITRLAGVLFERGELEEARGLWDQALANSHRPGQFKTRAVLLQHMALVEQRMDAFPSAERRMLDGLAALEEDLDENGPVLASGLARTARLYRGNGDFNRAEPLLRRSIEILEGTDGQEDWVYAQALCHLGQAATKVGKDEEAAGLLEQSLLLIERHRRAELCPRMNELLAEVNLALGDLYFQRGETDRAVERWEETIRLLELNAEDDTGATNHLISAGAWLRLNHDERARPHAETLIAKGWKWPPLLEQFR